jgi:hypothetical protein|tara:strand:- start:13966 stop:14103 length:138 start_codon:yes stop_codon:yes gene_type:complete
MKKQLIIEKTNPQHKQHWEWEETPELVKALAQLEKSSKLVEELSR